ncbi:unnamed protein product [Calypogeia fissa]
MPRNTKPPGHGPSPSGNMVTTSVQEFAAPSTVLDREIMENDLVILGTKSPASGVPAPIHNPQAHQDKLEEFFISSSSVEEVMSRNTKPSRPGPSPIGNGVMTDVVQEFAGPSTVLDREIIEGFSSAGSNGFQPEGCCNYEPNTGLETKQGGHKGDDPVTTNTFLGVMVGREADDPEGGVGPDSLKSFEATSLSVFSSQSSDGVEQEKLPVSKI